MNDIFSIYTEKYTNGNKNSLDSLDASLSQLHKTYEIILNKLKKAYDENIKQLNDLVKIYQKQVV